MSGFRIALNYYSPDEQLRVWINSTSPYPITINDLDVEWHGLTPTVSLSEINILMDPESVFHIDHAHLRFHLWSLLRGQIKLKTGNLHFVMRKNNTTTDRGYLRSLALHTSALSRKVLDIDFKDLIITSQVTMSSISYLSGDFKLNPQRRMDPKWGLQGLVGTLKLKGHQLEFHEPRLFNRKISLTDYACDLTIQKKEKDWILTAKLLKAKHEKTHIKAKGSAVFSPDSSLPIVDSLIEVDKISIEEGLTLLPREWMPAAVTQWLDSALVSGNLVSTAMVLRGDLDDFPFDNNEGIFEVYSELDNGILRYDPHWPILEGLKANMLFRNRSMIIDGDYAQFEGGRVEDVEVIIPDLASSDPKLTVDAKIQSTLERGKEVLLTSPLRDKIGSHLKQFNLQGKMDLSLGLVIPLSKNSDSEIKVRGLIGLNNNHFAFLDDTMILEQLTGEMQFSESHLLAHTLQGKLLGGEHQLSLSADFSAANPTIHVGSQGELNINELAKWRDLPLQTFVQGKTIYKMNFDFSPKDKNQYHLAFQTPLKGVAIEAPNPFSKKSEEEKPLQLDMYFEPNDVLRFSAKYGDGVNLAYSLQKGKTPQTLGGHLYLGEKQLAKFREDGVFLIDGEVKELNFDAWKHFFNQWKASMGESLDNTNTLEPLIELDVENLSISDLPLHHTKIEAEWQNDHQQWNIECDGPSVKGRILLAKDKQKDLQIRLQKLVLNTKEAKALSEFAGKPLSPLEQPINATIADCRINDMVLNQVFLRLSAAPHGYAIDHFSTQMQGADMNLSGEWKVIDKRSFVAVKGKMKVQNMTDVFKALDRSSSITQAKGMLDFNLSWEGQPFKIDFPTLAGVLDMRLQKGSIRGMNSGLGRVLNLLNLDNMTRRLNFDFSDITKNGFVFDQLTGRLQFGNAKVSSNDIMIDGPSAKILGYGQADLNTQAVRGQMTVMPNLTGTFPIAAALAVGTPFAGPLIGAAVWAADKIVGDKIQEIQRFRYQIAGTWDSPQIEEMRYSINPFSLLE